MPIDTKRTVYRSRAQLLELGVHPSLVSQIIDPRLEQIERCMKIAREVLDVSGQWKIPYPSAEYFTAVREAYLCTVAVRGWPDLTTPGVNILECLALAMAERLA